MISSTPSRSFSGSILADDLGKAYRLRSGAGTTKLKFDEWVADQAGRMFSPAKWTEKPGYFWALRGIHFEIQPGELIGLVGSNGSGKSTLLKLLARVTKPTAGRAWLRGRVGSLLEVGTGFHPELTGFENIYLCGTILGMSRAEIARKFDEIVAFSEVQPFLDIPIKRLSSGMAMRLAFSVAAHLHPDILLVDEALSVGDVAFQKKCLAKMQTFAASGATVIFVTHDLALVSKSCRRVLLLEKGELREDGPTASVLPKYLAVAEPATGSRIRLERNPTVEKSGVTVQELVLNDGDAVRHGQPLHIELTLVAEAPMRNVSFCISFANADGVGLLACDSAEVGRELHFDEARLYRLSIRLPRLDLVPGTYLVDVALQKGATHLDIRRGCLNMTVLAPEGSTDATAASSFGSQPLFECKLT
jgi:lipopolysaccharide transport system ATP-binding protein